MTTTDLAAAVRRLDAAIAAGDVIRGEWTRTEDGRERACLLAALAPVCGVERTSSACPAEVLPPWLAECVPWIDDAGTEGVWPEMIQTFADLLRDSAGAPAELWPRLNLHWRRVAIAETMAHTANLTVLGVCAEVAALLDAELAGEQIDSEAWADAGMAACEARRPATWAEAAAARSASCAAAAAAARAASCAAASATSATTPAAQSAADRITAEFFASWRAELTS